MNAKRSRWGFQWAWIILAMSIPVVGFTTAAVVMFLHNHVWPGVTFTILAFFTMPNVRIHPPTDEESDRDSDL